MMDTDESDYVSVLDVLERLNQQGIAMLRVEYPRAEIRTGCDHRFAVRIDDSQWWEYDSLRRVEARILFTLATTLEPE